jgi:hypothetical protein
VATDLTRIREKARKEPGLVFTSLYHHICDMDNLRACYDALGAHKATGVDGVTKQEYGKNLEENLRDLLRRLQQMGYRPEPKGPWSPSMRPYSKTAVTDIARGAASIGVWTSWGGRSSRRRSAI